MLAKWFRVKSWKRSVIVLTGLVAVGFAMDSVDHAFGWKALPSYVVLPCFVILATYLMRDRREEDPGA